VLEAVADVLDGGVEAAGELRKRLEGHFWSVDFSPGSLPWYADEHFQPQLPWSLRLLHALASPSPGFSRPLDDRTTLTVHNFYPHTEQWPYSKAAESGPGFAALRVRLTTPMARRPMEHWVTSLPAFERDPSPIALELMVLAEPALLPEFLHPPEPKALGKQGELVLAVGHSRKLCRVNLDELEVGRAIDLPGTDLQLTLKKYGELMDLLGHKAEEGRQSERASYPCVQFELSGPGGRGTYLCCARLPHMPAWQEGDEVEDVAGWYHFPDFRWGDRQKMGALHFLQGPGGTVYYRVYGKDGLRQAGEEIDATNATQQYTLPWQPMEMQMQLAGYLPHASRKPSVLPRDVRPGAEPAEPLEPALRCSLGGDGEEQEFWVRMSRQATRVRVGDRLYFVRYRMASRPADFSLTLKKAQQVTDPGTSRPASFQSDVVLTREEGGTPLSTEHAISMNNTLDHGRYKMYQTNYRPLADPETLELVVDREGKLVSVSGLTVACDPGLVFKYPRLDPAGARYRDHVLDAGVLLQATAAIHPATDDRVSAAPCAAVVLLLHQSEGIRMTPQTSDLLPVSSTTDRHGQNEAMRTWRRQPGPPSRFAFLYWPLLAFGLLLSAVVLGTGVYLAGFANPSAAPADHRIIVPYADNAALWEPLRRWPVQEDGRVKPFETFCREAVRTITGRERFEGNDPVAVVGSWLLLYDPDRGRAGKLGRDMDADWENYPFILCDNHELRERLFRDFKGEDADLTEEELHGKYVAPAVLRYSTELKKLLRSGAARMEQDSKAALSSLETKATEVKKRLALYERIRGGGQEGRQRVHAPGEFGVVALDAHGPTWFSLKSVREYADHPDRWEEALTARRIENPSMYEGAEPPTAADGRGPRGGAGRGRLAGGVRVEGRATVRHGHGRLPRRRVPRGGAVPRTRQRAADRARAVVQPDEPVPEGVAGEPAGVVPAGGGRPAGGRAGRWRGRGFAGRDCWRTPAAWRGR